MTAAGLPALTCDRCGSPVNTTTVTPRGTRPGRLVAQEPIVTGYYCTNGGCARARGFGMGEKPIGAE